MKEINPREVERILIRGTNWVGDAVMSIPAMRAVRRIFPKARISLLVRPWVRDVYASVEFVDEILDYDKQGIHRGWRGRSRLVAGLKRERFDLALLLQNAFEAALLTWYARIPLRIGYARDGRGFLLTHACRIHPELRTVHQAYYYLGILAEAGLLEPCPWKRKDSAIDITIGVRDSDRESASRLLDGEGIGADQPLVGLNPGAYYGGAKRWIPDRYARVADALVIKYGVGIVIVGSADELTFAQEIARQMSRVPAILSGKTTLGQLMAVIKRCELFITNDSGPMHLAAALDTPQIAIFGSTSEIATGPLSRDAEVIRQPVDCSACFLRECPIDLRCMTRVTAEQVLSAADKKLAARRAGKRSK
jgi:heptosyltransferase-2